MFYSIWPHRIQHTDSNWKTSYLEGDYRWGYACNKLVLLSVVRPHLKAKVLIDVSNESCVRNLKKALERG